MTAKPRRRPGLREWSLIALALTAVACRTGPERLDPAPRVTRPGRPASAREAAASSESAAETRSSDSAASVASEPAPRAGSPESGRSAPPSDSTTAAPRGQDGVLKPKDEKPRAYYWYYLKGRLHLREGNYNFSAAQFSRSLELRSDFAESLFYRGLARAHMGEDLDAAVDYERALSLSARYGERKDYAEVYIARGLFKIRRGKEPTEIFKDLRLAQRMGPDTVDTSALADEFFARALRRVEGEQDEAARGDYEAAMRIAASPARKSEFARAFDRRGLKRRAANRLAEAVADFEFAVSLDPKDLLAYEHLEEARLALRRRTEALKIDKDSSSLDLGRLRNLEVTPENYEGMLAQLDGLRERSARVRDAAVATDLLEATNRLRRALWTAAFKAAAKSRETGALERSWSHVRNARLLADDARKERTEQLYTAIATDWSRELVARAAGLPDGRADEVEVLMTEALSVDPDNTSARLFLEERRQARKAKTRKAVTEAHAEQAERVARAEENPKRDDLGILPTILALTVLTIGFVVILVVWLLFRQRSLEAGDGSSTAEPAAG